MRSYGKVLIKLNNTNANLIVIVSYNSNLLDKKEIILLTKSDLVSKEKLAQITKEFKGIGKEVVPISIYDWDSLEKLKKILIS